MRAIIFLLACSSHAQILAPIIGGNILATPTFSPGAGTYVGTQSVTITLAGGSTGWYNNTGTFTGCTPSACSGATQISGAVSVSTTQTLYAIATEVGYTNSAVGSAAYVINAASISVRTYGCEVNGATPSAACTMSATPTVGDTLLIGGRLNTGGTFSGCTDNQSPANTYTFLSHGMANSRDMALWAAYVATASGTFTVTCSGSGSVAEALSGMGASGVASSSPQDGSGVQNYGASGTSLSCGGITLSNAGSLVAMFAWSNGATLSAGTNYTAVANSTFSSSNPNFFMEYYLPGATGSQNPSMTSASGAGNYCAAAAVLP